MYLDLGTLIDVAVQGLIRVIAAVRDFVAHQMGVDALAVRALEFARWTRDIGLFTLHLVRMVPAIVLPVAAILIPYALEVLAGELVRGTGLVPRIAHLTLVRAIAAVVVVVAKPAL